MSKRSALLMTVLGLIVGLSMPSYAVQPPPNASEVDFCALMDGAYGLVTTKFAWLLELLGDDAALLEMIRCDIADLNGGLNEDDMPTPNGMLDGNYELRIIKELIQNPSKYANLASGTLPGQVKPGVNPTNVVNAYNTNYQKLYTDGMYSFLTVTLPSLWGILRGMYPTVPPLCTGPNTPPGCVSQQDIVTLFRNLLMVLAGYATVGDAPSAETVAAVASLLALCDVLSPGSCLVNDIERNPANYSKLPAFLSKDGDADGDGYTNFAEYEEFADVKGPGDAFIAAVLDPSIYPGYVPPASEKVKIYPSGTIKVEEGGTIDLKVVVKDLVAPISYQWTKNGEDIDGATEARLVIRNVTTADGGAYQCVVTDASKGIYASAVVNVQIVPEGTIPVATGIGLAVITAVCSLGGVMALRRRR
ncbi:MAG: immunoglobulin domain-containing protein [Candidatus Hydrogenedentes bacterium]|nr:immunoglobulin domain-containing protein [Candidatus Hydrogenedentota bacterium]